MQKISEFFKKYWAIIVGALSLLVYAIIQRDKRLDAEATKDTSLSDYKDQVANAEVAENTSKIKEIQKNLDKNTQEEQLAKDKAKEATDADKEAFWKKKLGE